MIDWTQILVALIVAVPGTLAALLSYRTGVKVEEVRHATNGLTKALGDAKKAQGVAEGTAAGLEQGRAEEKAGK